MLADQNNYQPDKQFTDRGWNEMLKTLDQEMPVQKRKRRGFFWLFPLLLIGLVASVWAFYPTYEKTEITQKQKAILGQSQANNQNKIQTLQYESASNFEIKDENIVTESKTTETSNEELRTSKVKNDDDFPSIIDSSNPLLPRVIEEILPIEKTKNIEQKDPLAKLETEIQSINSIFITIELQKQEELAIEEKEFFFEEKIIVETPEPIKRKTEFGIFAGVVGDFAKIKKIGMTSGGYVHFPMGKKLGLRTGLGYSQLQKDLSYTFIGNQDASLSAEFLQTSIATPPPFSRVTVLSNAVFVLEKFHQLDVPVLLTYSPNKKLEFQFGANASYLLKDKTRLVNNSININEAVNDDYSIYGIELDALDLNSISLDQYSDENYWTKLNVSAIAGLVWKPTRKFNLGLQYHHGFLPILKSTSNNNSSLVTGSTARDYEVFNNSAYEPFSLTMDENRFEKLFKKEKFTKYNYSIRFTVGYNF